MRKILYILLILFSITFLVGCNEDKTDNDTPVVEIPFDLTNVVFESIEVSYDGETHSVFVKNLPAGVGLVYSGNDVIEVGVHTVVAKLFYNGTLIKELTATITIIDSSSSDLVGVVFESVVISYDGELHSIYAVNIPEGVTAEYNGNEVSEVGVHTVVLKLYDENNNLLEELSATITIVEASDVELPWV